MTESEKVHIFLTTEDNSDPMNISGGKVSRIGEAYGNIKSGKEYSPEQLKELEGLYHRLNDAMMFDSVRVYEKQQAIKDWKIANGNLLTPKGWNAPCID